MPEKIDEGSGYRYYGEQAFFRAQTIKVLKNLGFSLNEIKAILRECRDDSDVAAYLARKIEDVENRIQDLTEKRKQLKIYKKSIAVPEIEAVDIHEGVFEETWICGIRLKGQYKELGPCYRKLWEKSGRFIRGKPMGFYYDLEFKEHDADMEAAVAVSEELNITGINCRVFPATPAVSIIHKGPYGTQGENYLKLFSYCKMKGYKLIAPLIERYVRGPGMFFKGSPNRYLTELIALVEK